MASPRGLFLALDSTPISGGIVQKQKPDEDQIRRTYEELKSGDWLPNAHRRAQRRKSAWNLLLPLFGLPFWFGFTFLFVTLAWLAHIAFHPGHTETERQFLSHVKGIGPLLMVLPFVIASLFPAFIVTNFLVYLIPPARRAMDKEDRDFPGTDYKSSQRALIKVGAVALGIAMFLALVGAAIGGTGSAV